MKPTRIVRSDTRVTQTPNASMTTLASPSQGGTSTLSLWRVTMRSGQCGPEHTFDVEQVWHLLDGTAVVAVDSDVDANPDSRVVRLSAGDTVVLPAGVRRQVSTESGATFVVTGPADGLATPITADGPAEPVAPAWIV